MRVALIVAVLACLGVGVVLRAPAIFWSAGAVLAAGLGLGEIALHRKTRTAGRQRERRDPTGRDEATRVVVPWRSSPFWNEFDLTVKAARPNEWFCFYGHAGDSITLTAEAPPPGSGVSVCLFDADEDYPPLAEAKSDEHGLVVLTASTATTGIHHVRVQAVGSAAAAPQRYRMSIAGPRRAREAGPSSGRHEGFSDVPLWHPHHDAIQRVTEAGLMTGQRVGGDLRFGPDRPMWEADFIETIGGYLETQGESPAGPPQARGSEAEAAGATADPNRDATRAQVLVMLVDALDSAFPGLLVGPRATGLEPEVPDAGSQEYRLAVADYNGLLAGVEGFTSEEDLKNSASRGEVAQLLDSLLQLVEHARVKSRAPAAARTAVANPAESLPDWDSEAGLTEDFITGANEALDSLIGVHVLSPIPTNGGQHIDAETLRSTIEAMRERHEVRVKDKAQERAQERAQEQMQPTLSSTPLGNGSAGPIATVDDSTTRAPSGARTDTLRSLRRRNGRRVSRFKPRS